MGLYSDFADDDPRLEGHNSRIKGRYDDPPKPKPKRRRRRKPGPKRKPKKYLSRKQREVREVLAKISTHQLYGELSRRANKARLASMTPEKRQQLREEALVRQELQRQTCRHEIAPRLRKHDKGKGKPAGSWWCPSCKQTVAAPRVDASGELEIVV